MKAFDYIRAQGVEDAARQAAEGATFIAGGTNLLDLMKLEVMAPDRLVDINRLDLAGIEEEPEGGLRIGALVTVWNDNQRNWITLAANGLLRSP